MPKNRDRKYKGSRQNNKQSWGSSNKKKNNSVGTFLAYKSLKEYVKPLYNELPYGHRFFLFPKLWEINENTNDFKTYTEKFKILKEYKNQHNVSKNMLESLKERQYLLSQRIKDNLLWKKNVISSSRFVTGMGIDHPLENGFAFLKPYGVPYIPGSSVKGVFRRAAEELALFGETNTKWNLVKVWLLFGFDENSSMFRNENDKKVKNINVIKDEIIRWKNAYKNNVIPNDEARSLSKTLLHCISDKKTRKEWENNSDNLLQGVFENEKLRKNIHISGLLSFWDVFPILRKGLDVDVMNPHYNHYYQGVNKDGKKVIEPPHDSGTPTPIFFLTIPENTEFNFYIQYLPNPFISKKLEKDIPQLLSEAFVFASEILGFGAKTSVGYGRMINKNIGGHLKSKDSETEETPSEAPGSSSGKTGNIIPGAISENPELEKYTKLKKEAGSPQINTFDTLLNQIESLNNEKYQKDLINIIKQKIITLKKKKKVKFENKIKNRPDLCKFY